MAAQGVQAEEEPAIRAVPLELFSCAWEDGKGMKDLMKASERFNKWADKHDMKYSAWTITPQFRSSEQPFDVGWIGAWQSGEALGAGMQAWQDNGAEEAQEFADVMDCTGAHGLMSSVALNMPQGEPSKAPLVQFSSCSVNDGKTAEDAYNAHKAFSDYMVSQGGQAAAWLLYPALGAGDIDFDYYAVSAYASYAQLGVAFEAYVNGDGWKKAQNELFSVVSCDNPRLYDGKLVRNGAGG